MIKLNVQIKLKKRGRMKMSNDKNLEFYGKVEFPVTCTIGRGLENAIAANTRVGYVNGKLGKLYYRGYSIEDLARYSTYEETAFLLLYGHLPNKKEFEDFSMKLKENRDVPEDVVYFLKKQPVEVDPMNLLMSGISLLAGYDDLTDVGTIESEREVAIKIISKIATLAAMIGRIKCGKNPIKPRDDLTHAENFLYMITGEVPSEYNARAFDVALILHADHGMNASTFTGMVIHSGLTDMYSSIAGSIGCLKGYLHGGANERVIYMLEEIGDVNNVEKWYWEQRKQKKKIPGFGHRVYKTYDPRARILKKYAIKFCKEDKLQNLCKIADALEKVVINDLGKTKKIFPNVDYYSGLVYMGIGIHQKYMFTPIFAVARSAGWAARIIEYMEDNRIFRPRANYYGPLDLEYMPIEKR